ncbi:hypothetical protein CC86DRAFT_402112 [Ophiobolus disseminans]|uniref:Uncharacterized protein n=1 Tax=Ophiobolus disseminans TaxID=1469910 RepID=A0A6A7AE59_9PLEO|nr:hypothetical protein CC86DRAFT_402112 [Ophiobolus disseminans]
MAYTNDIDMVDCSTESSRLAEHAANIKASVNATLREDVMEGYEVAIFTDHEAEERVFQVACQIALHYASRLHWSNYHPWSFYRNKTHDDVRNTAPGLWDAIYPFSTSLGSASHITTALIQALSADSQLARYADDVQLVSNATLEEVKESPQYHSFTMIRFWYHCIVIDLSSQHTAFKIYVGSLYKSPERLVPFHPVGASFQYAYVAGPNGARLLVECDDPVDEEPCKAKRVISGNPESIFLSKPAWFNGRIVDVEGGVRGGEIDYAYRSANPTLDTPLGPMPRRRTIVTQAIWDHAPESPWILSTPLGDGKFLVDTLSLRVDIIK